MSASAYAAELRQAFTSCPGCGRTREELRRQYSQMHENFYLTIEHLLPRSLGGTNSRENLMIICRRCNTARGNQMPWDWHGEHNMIFKDHVSNRQRKRMERRAYAKERALEIIDDAIWQFDIAGTA